MHKVFIGAIALLTTATVVAQRPGQSGRPPAGGAAPDTAKGPGMGARPTSGPKAYRDVITAKAKTSKGMFDVHFVDNKYYFEIPGSLLGREILTVARLGKAPTGLGSYAGDAINQRTIAFDKGPGDKIFLKLLSFIETGRDSTEGMYKSVLNSNVQPIAAAFDVKAFGRDSSSYVIDVTDFITGDNDVFFFSAGSKRSIGLSNVFADRSFVISTKSFPTNIEIKTQKTYNRTPTTSGAGGGGMMGGGSSQPVTYELNTSLVLLPKVPMKPRYFDDRVGYFTTQSITDFDINPHGIERFRYIARYRLEPRDEDVEKYKRGELVEPKKQIVYYIDPTTPKKWIPYLIAGVNDWQAAFEKAGFKNAIVGKVAPTYEQDSTFSLEDARHSAIVYKPSDIPNASGPNIHDPRSGEIIESHVNWYHNVMSLVRNWYIVQTGAVDPAAQTINLSDELMGQLIRFVSSHEIGHTLGLRHNFGSSSTVPVENLRNKAWVEANGHTPSIMDYARFNYVAQPEDKISQVGLFPRIGDYDKWAIEWGYRWLPDQKTADDEVAVLNQRVIKELTANKRLWWGDGEGNRGDPRSQTEDLGDNSMKASSYGLKNLKRIIVKLPEWTKQPNKDYTELAEMYSQVTSQFGRYIGHVTNNVGGIERTPKRVEQAGPVYGFTAKATQKEAVQWVKDNVFTTPTWVIQENVTALTNQTPLTVIGGLQERAISGLVNVSTINNLLRFESESPATAYTATELLTDVRKSVFSELATRKATDAYRRQLQKSLVNKLADLVKVTPPQQVNLGGSFISLSSGFDKKSDGPSLIKAQLRTLAAEIKAATPLVTDAATKNHLLDLQDRIKEALEPSK
ncbi:zinc-dependent metalloprotease [Terrimonas rubra]|uniref:Zinc-dependent metalloprotease n=1 Tax=Terrimonas rubra TaxID=1035890 RepID=A0ABW6A8X7_9BACT